VWFGEEGVAVLLVSFVKHHLHIHVNLIRTMQTFCLPKLDFFCWEDGIIVNIMVQMLLEHGRLIPEAK
jgi:hypothetical protein